MRDLVLQWAIVDFQDKYPDGQCEKWTIAIETVTFPLLIKSHQLLFKLSVFHFNVFKRHRTFWRLLFASRNVRTQNAQQAFLTNSFALPSSTAVAFIFGFMPLGVEGQVIRSGEAALTHCAAERFGSGVFPDVTGQFIGSGEAPFTRWKMTCIGFFTWKKILQNQQNILVIKFSNIDYYLEMDHFDAFIYQTVHEIFLRTFFFYSQCFTTFYNEPT